MCVMMTEIYTIHSGQKDALIRRANIKKPTHHGIIVTLIYLITFWWQWQKNAKNWNQPVDQIKSKRKKKPLQISTSTRPASIQPWWLSGLEHVSNSNRDINGWILMVAFSTPYIHTESMGIKPKLLPRHSPQRVPNLGRGNPLTKPSNQSGYKAQIRARSRAN